MLDPRKLPAFQSLQILAEALDDAVRRGTIDLGTAAELLEHETSAWVELARMLESVDETRFPAMGSQAPSAPI
jgi:hypothetical protein